MESWADLPADIMSESAVMDRERVVVEVDTKSLLHLITSSETLMGSFRLEGCLYSARVVTMLTTSMVLLDLHSVEEVVLEASSISLAHPIYMYRCAISGLLDRGTHWAS